jgi:hypothetical protein
MTIISEDLNLQNLKLAVFIQFAIILFLILATTFLLPKALNSFVQVFSNKVGPVDQSGMIAAFATRKPRVQIPLGPLLRPLAPFLSLL